MIIGVDLETGKVKVLKYVAIHDVGKIIDSASVEAQVYEFIMKMSNY